MCSLALACSSSSKNRVDRVDGGAGNAGTGGSAGAGGSSGAAGSSASTGKWPDSATANCSDGTISNTECPVDGTDYYGQDGNFELNVPTYAVSGTELTDSVTGLHWQFGASDVTQQEAVAGCNGSSGAWRLPSFLELASLPDYGNDGNAVPTAVGKGTNLMWTASEAPAANANWTFSPNSGVPSVQGSSMLLASACVSGPEIQASLGTPKDGVVQDALTGLYWQTSTVTNRNWKEALLHCLKAQGAGLQTGWRLPTVKELITIAKTDSWTAIDLNIFDAAAEVWSSTPLVDDGTQAWVVNFNPLSVTPTGLAATHHVRCVHDPI